MPIARPSANYDHLVLSIHAPILAPTLAWVHDLSPVLVNLGPIPIRWYGLSYITGFLAAWFLLTQMGKRGWSAIKPEAVADLMLVLIIGVFVGGRLGYVVFYQPSLLWTFSPDLPFWAALAVNKGGMASHGGMIGVVLAAWLWARRSKLSLLHVMDAMALVAPIGLFFGRLANFINGELLGRVASLPGQPRPWWAIRYPQELLERRDETLAALDSESRTRALATLEASIDNAEMGMLVRGEISDRTLYDTAAARIIQSVQQGNPDLTERLASVLTARHPSQLYQAFAEGVVVFAAVWLAARKPRRAGIVSAWFLVAYGVGRIATEFFRLPDAHFGAAARFLGLSRGQWLSAAMVVIGVAILAIVSRSAKASPTIGGWASRRVTTPNA